MPVPPELDEAFNAYMRSRGRRLRLASDRPHTERYYVENGDFLITDEIMRSQIQTSPDFKQYSLALDEAMKPFRDQTKFSQDILDAADERINDDLRKLGFDSEAIKAMRNHVRENRIYPEASKIGTDWPSHDARISQVLDLYAFKVDGDLHDMFGEGWRK